MSIFAVNSRAFPVAISHTWNTATVTTVYRTFIQDNPGEPAPELSETLTQYTTLIV